MFSIEPAVPAEAETIAQMVKALLEEIMSTTGAAHFANAGGQVLCFDSSRNAGGHKRRGSGLVF